MASRRCLSRTLVGLHAVDPLLLPLLEALAQQAQV